MNLMFVVVESISCCLILFFGALILQCCMVLQSDMHISYDSGLLVTLSELFSKFYNAEYNFEFVVTTSF